VSIGSLSEGDDWHLDRLNATFTKWLGVDYDLGAIHLTLVAAAAIQLGGDPLWMMLVSGPGNAKTETVAALRDSGAHVVSTIASEGALLSGTSKGERAADATGGLLREIGESGVLVMKDFTSILSLSPNARPQVLAALREVYDGCWTRTIGADGGRTLEWSGRIAVIAAVTTAWDKAHAVVSEMGDRFVLLRMDSTENRLTSGRQAIANTGSETAMRNELAAAVKNVMENIDTRTSPLDDQERETVLRAADLVTLARTAVWRDRQGNVIDAHAPEMPTRFAKQLSQVVRGGVAVGLTRPQAIRLAIRCARDSIPPLRLAILRDLAHNPDSMPSQVRKRVDKPHNTVDRELQALHMLGLVMLDEQPYINRNGDERSRWRYSLAEGVDVGAVFPDSSQDPLSDATFPNSSQDPQRGRGVVRFLETVAVPRNPPGAKRSRTMTPLRMRALFLTMPS
jgi:DNA-binding transcriptional ArsR family regulator